MNHFTNKKGYNAISASSPWRFLARKPPGRNPKGAYFTTLGRRTPNLASRLRIPKDKVQFVFSFVDVGDLKPLKGGRGEYVFYSSKDYLVDSDRQDYCGAT